MKKVSIIAAAAGGVLLAAAAITSTVFYKNSSDKAIALHDSIQTQYEEMIENTSRAVVTVLENGETVGEYTLNDLGLLEITCENIRSCFNDTDLMEDNAFRQLSLREKTAWCQDTDNAFSVQLDPSDAELAPIIDDLRKTNRVEPSDAYVYYEDEAYHIEPETPGNALDEASVRKHILEKLAEMNIDPESTDDICIDIGEDCYKQPEITSESDFDFPAILHKDISKLSLTINFHSNKKILRGHDLEKYISVDGDGRIKVDSAALLALTQSWEEECKEELVPFLFDSFVEGSVPIDFVRCSYTLDSEKLAEQIVNHILAFDSTPITADYHCFDRKGEPFDISDTHVEVDIKNQHLAFYKNGELVVETDVVTGRPSGHDTPTGLYHAYDKQVNRWLTGADYCVFVNYWVRVTGGYGLHDANWRSVFGEEYYLTNGSHGCVNIPIEAMTLIYAAIEDGDAILIH